VGLLLWGFLRAVVALLPTNLTSMLMRAGISPPSPLLASPVLAGYGMVAWGGGAWLFHYRELSV
jgi:hypothetical protein